MPDQDIPLVDPEIAQLPSDIRMDLAERGRSDLYFFNKGILGYNRLTPGCHGPLCTFMDLNKSRFKGILMPRDHYKTTNCTVGADLQLVVRDPEQRILLGNENALNASRFMDIIKSHAESNAIFRGLYSSIIPKDYRKTTWNSTAITFLRQGHYAEPTIDTIGMTGTMTSRHYTHITIDDPISEEAVKSDKVMMDVITRIDKIFSLFVDPEVNTFWLVATRWAFNDVVAFFKRKLGHRFAWFIRGAIEDGLPIFPELISLETLADIRDTIGDYAYSCLYMNNPRNPDIQDFNTNDLRYWRWDTDEESIVLYEADRATIKTVVDLSDLDVVTTVDPAASETTANDRNAVVTTGVTAQGDCIVLDAWAKRCSPLELINYIFLVNSRYHPRLFGIEDIAYQKTLKYFVRAEAMRRGEYLRIEPVKRSGKDAKVRSIRGLQPIAATGRLYVQPTMHTLRDELSDFPLGEHDDVIDCLSMQQGFWRGLMSPTKWEHYRQSERRLLSRISGYGIKGQEASDTDIEDEEDEDEHSDSWTDTVFG